jgi:hypothetical protein
MSRQIAPRLANGDSRVSFGHGLPESIKNGLRSIARRERKSMSWVMEEVIIDYFKLARPKYKEPNAAHRTHHRKR